MIVNDLFLALAIFRQRYRSIEEEFGRGKNIREWTGREGGGRKGVCIGFVVAAAAGTGRPEPGEEGWGGGGRQE